MVTSVTLVTTAGTIGPDEIDLMVTLPGEVVTGKEWNTYMKVMEHETITPSPLPDPNTLRHKVTFFVTR